MALYKLCDIISTVMSLLVVIVVVLNDNCESNDHNYQVITRNPYTLKLWATFEIYFIQNLTEKVAKMKRSMDPHLLSQFEMYHRDFEETFELGSSGSVEEKVLAITRNPIATFRMINRIVRFLPTIFQKFLRSGATLIEEMSWPRSEDLEDAVLSILRLHNIYNFHAEEFADGDILGRKTRLKLNGVDCYQIGLLAQSRSLHTLAFDWFELGLRKAAIDKSIDLELIEIALGTTVTRHDELFERGENVMNPFFFDGKLNSEFKSTRTRRKQRDIFDEAGQQLDEVTLKNLRYWSLCSKGSSQSEKEKSKLFCWFESKGHWNWVVGPLRMEFLSHNPDIVQIYNILGNKTIERIKKNVQSKLKMSQVAEGPNEMDVSVGRTSVGTWIDELKDKSLVGMSLKIQLITGLQVTRKMSAELLQVASYSTGGHYGIHFDALTEAKLKGVDKAQGDRIATFMYYLSDVELGGDTAFVEAGTVAKPVKGSAVFWYNTLRNGSRDPLTLHGACPVVIGEKWITTTWIRSNDQMFTHPCSPDPQQRFHINVNGIIFN